MGGEAFYLLNATDGNLRKSGMAFYADEDAVNSRSDPTAYIDIENAGWTNWEDHIHSGIFPNTDNFRTCILGNAQGFPSGSLVGFARNNNRAWNIFKNDERVVWQKNGWTYMAVYSCE